MCPGAGDDAILDATGGDYTVTSKSSETVNGIQTAANATFDIDGNTSTEVMFEVLSGTDGGVNAGTIRVTSGAILLLAGGTVDNEGLITVGVHPRTTAGISIEGGTTVTLDGGGNLILGSGFFAGNDSPGISTLINVDNIISGSGEFYGVYGGDLNYVNQIAGVIDASVHSEPSQFYMATVANQGILESTDHG